MDNPNQDENQGSFTIKRGLFSMPPEESQVSRPTGTGSGLFSGFTTTPETEPQQGLFTMPQTSQPPVGLFSGFDRPRFSTPPSTSVFQAPVSRPSFFGRKRSLDDTESEQKLSPSKLFGETSTKRIAQEPVSRGLFGKAIPAAGIESETSVSCGEMSNTFQDKPPLQAPPMRRQRVLSSTSSISDVPEVSASTTLQCTSIPDRFNNKELLRRHFSKYGNVLRVQTSLANKSATVKFATHQEAAIAKAKGKNLGKETIHIYFKKRPQPIEKFEDKPIPERQQRVSVAEPTNQQKMLLKRAARMQQQPQHKAISKITGNSNSVYAKTDAEKLAILEKIDKILRSRVIKESDLSKATVTMGTCPDMCPEKERYSRQHKNLLSNYEMDGNRRVKHDIAVKEYSRSSADQEEALPHELRPSRVLRIAMDYLVTHVMRNIDYERIADWYDFLWNRTRAIRKEISIQQSKDPFAIEVTEECARFHICCAHQLCEADLLNFDPKINNENLEKTMKTVLDMYGDVKAHKDEFEAAPQNEREFRSYFILLNINRSSDVLRELQEMSVDIRYSPEVKLAVSAFSAVHSNNFSRFFNVLQHASYLQGALLHRYFTQVRKQAIHIMAKAYSAKGVSMVPVDDVIRILHFNDIVELEEFCASHVITINNGNVELHRLTTYEADSSSVRRSNEVLVKMNERCLGDIISHGRIPSHDLHEPTTSFDPSGKYIGPYLSLLTSSSVQTPPSTSPAVLTQRLTPDQVITKKLQSKGISNDVVKNLAKPLFMEVISEMVFGLGKEVIEATNQLLATGTVSCDILEEYINEEMKKMVSTTLVEEKLKREREKEELRRKQQEELKRKERKESIDRSTKLIAIEIEKQITSEIIQQTAKKIYRKETISHLSDVISDDVINSSLGHMLQGIVSEVVKQATKEKHQRIFVQVKRRCTRIRLQRWREELVKLRKYRHACETFPCTPVSRDLHQQVYDLLPEGIENVRGRRSFPLDIHSKCRLSLEPTPRLLEMHDKAISKVKKIIPTHESAYYDKLHLPQMVFENMVLPRLEERKSKNDIIDTILWKVALACSKSTRKGIWATWIHHKLGLRSRNDETCLNHIVLRENYFTQTSNLKLCHNVSVCCEVFDCESVNGMFGASSLIVLASQDDQNNWSDIRNHLHEAMHSKPSNPSIPLVIILCGFSCDDDDVVEGLEIKALAQLVSSYRIIGLEHVEFVENSQHLATALRWLVSNTETLPDLSCSTMRDLLEEQLSFHYITPLYRHMGLRGQQGLPSLNPEGIVEIYNSIMEKICGMLTNPRLMELSWPAEEFRSYHTELLFPARKWNTSEQFNKIKSIFERIKLPTFPQIDLCETFEDIQSEVTKYCHLVCPGHTALELAVDANISSFIRENDFMDVHSFEERFPWQRMVDAIASSIFEQIIYNTTNGDIAVSYFDSDMSDVEIPKKYLDQFSEVEFNGLEQPGITSTERDTTIHSRTEGATSNLHRILLEEDVEKVANVTDWMNDDDIAQATTNQSSELRRKLKKEAAESDEFERRLKQILESGSDFSKFTL